jgi:hypothetical protein
MKENKRWPQSLLPLNLINHGANECSVIFTSTVLKGKPCQEYDIHERQHFALLLSYKTIKTIFFKKNTSSKRCNAL